VSHNYTYKKQLQLLNELYVNKRAPKFSLIIHDIVAQGGYGKYYGYGGYGYGSEYFEAMKPKFVRLLSSIKNIFNRN
jgi:hypothetical protein